MEPNEIKNIHVPALAISGHALFPLVGHSKVPALADWPSVKPDPFLEGSAFVDNYGIVLTEEELVVDVDPRNFEDGDNPIKRLLDKCRTTKFDTYTVRTGGGGLHIYFRKPASVITRTKVKGWKGIEFKSKGAFLVGPGSIHPTTKKVYDVIVGDPYRFADCPDEILELCERSAIIANIGVEVKDDPVRRERFRIVLSQAPPAIQGSEGEPATLKLAMVGKDLGLPEEVTLEMMLDIFNPRCVPMWDDHEMAVKVRNAYMYGQNAPGCNTAAADFGDPEIDATQEQKLLEEIESDRLHAERSAGVSWEWADNACTRLKPSIVNVINRFRVGDAKFYVNPLHKLIRYNTFTGKIEFSAPAPWHTANSYLPDWRDDDTKMLRTYFSEKFHWSVTEDTIWTAVLKYAKEYEYHPIRDYFANIKWDGVERLKGLFIMYCGAEDSDYVREAGVRFMISMVARIMRPGCKVDTMPVLEGKQGIGKSEFYKQLGGDYYGSVTLTPHDKDTALCLAGKMLVEVPEMSGLRKADVDALKAFISKAVDTMRKPYGRLAEDIPRSSVFGGSINPEGSGEYLQDQTGGRRFWPIKCGDSIDIAQLIKDRDQLWAEAYARYLDGEIWWFTDPVVNDQHAEEIAKRTKRDAWESIIQKYLDSQEPPLTFVTDDDIAVGALGMRRAEINAYALSRIGVAMFTLGYRPAAVKSPSGRRMKGWQKHV